MADKVVQIAKEEILGESSSDKDKLNSSDVETLDLTGEMLFRMIMRYRFIKTNNEHEATKFFSNKLGIFRDKINLRLIENNTKHSVNIELSRICNLGYITVPPRGIVFNYLLDPKARVREYRDISAQEIFDLILKLNDALRISTDIQSSMGKGGVDVGSHRQHEEDSSKSGSSSITDTETQNRGRRVRTLQFTNSRKMTQTDLDEMYENIAKQRADEAELKKKQEEAEKERKKLEMETASRPEAATTTPLDTSMLLRMLDESHNKSEIFYITTEEAVKRDALQDTWLNRWKNPCFALDTPALPFYLDVLKSQSSVLNRQIFLSGLLVLIRNFENSTGQSSLGQGQIDMTHQYVHCTTPGIITSKKTGIGAHNLRKTACDFFLGRISHPSTNDSIERIRYIAQNTFPKIASNPLYLYTNNTSEDEVTRTVNSLIDIINGKDMNTAVTLGFLCENYSNFMEMVISSGVCLILRWALELEHSDHGDALQFLRFIHGGHIAEEIHKCLDIQTRDEGSSAISSVILELRSYLSSVIHCTQIQNDNFLQPNTLPSRYRMIKRDVCDFMYSFFGNYEVEHSSHSTTKYVNVNSEFISEEYFQRKKGSLRFPDNCVANLAFLNIRNFIPLVVKYNGESVPAVYVTFRGFTRNLLETLFSPTFDSGLKISGGDGSLRVLLPRDDFDTNEILQRHVDTHPSDPNNVTIQNFLRRLPGAARGDPKPKPMRSEFQLDLLQTMDKLVDRLLLTLHI